MAFNLKSRFLNKKTFFSVILAVFILYIIFRDMDFKGTYDVLIQINIWWFLAAFVLFYLTYLLKAIRWNLLLDSLNFSAPMWPLAKIIFISQFVNCIVPAKLGDLYRAHLLKTDFNVERSKSFGTIFMERFFDIAVLVLIIITSAYFVLKDKLMENLMVSIILSVLFVLGIAVFLIILKYYRHWFLRFLPEKIHAIVHNFEEGTRLKLRHFPAILFYSIIPWIMTILVFYLLTLSIGLEMSFEVATLVVLASGLLSAVPFTPGGLGVVEGGMRGILILVGVSDAHAFSLIILYRIISYWLHIVFGFLVYVVKE